MDERANTLVLKAKAAVMKARNAAAALPRLSRAARERAFAGAVFAAILSVGVWSTDYLITGGPDWNPGGMGAGQAFAMEFPRFEGSAEAPLETDAPPPVPPQDIDIVALYPATSDTLLGGLDWRMIDAEIETPAEIKPEPLAFQAPAPRADFAKPKPDTF